MLEREFKYFKDNHARLLEEYPNKYLVIQEDKVLFAEDSMESAIEKAVEAKLEAGTYMVQLCSEGDSAFTQTFHSRVVFA